MGKGQVIASAIILIAISIVIGYALGNFLFKFSDSSQTGLYRVELMKSAEQAESIKTLLKQEREYAVDKTLFTIAGRGGFGKSWSQVSIQAEGLKRIDEDYIPEKEIPYYYVNGEINYPKYEFIASNTAEHLLGFHTSPGEIRLQELFGIDLKINYELILKGLAENSNELTTYWYGTPTGNIITRGDLNSKKMVDYEFSVTANQKIKTPFNALYSASKQFVEEQKQDSIIEQVTSKYNSLLWYEKIGENCVFINGIYKCDNVNIAIKEVKMGEEKEALKHLYCNTMKNYAGCDDYTCKAEGGCEGACYYDLKLEGCPTSRDKCLLKCPSDITEDLKFVCACDDWECLCEEGQECATNTKCYGTRVCVHAGYYPVTYLRSNDYNFVETEEERYEKKEYDEHYYTNLNPASICKDGAYGEDECCTRRLDYPETTCTNTWTDIFGTTQEEWKQKLKELTKDEAEKLKYNCNIKECAYNDGECQQRTVEAQLKEDLQDTLVQGIGNPNIFNNEQWDIQIKFADTQKLNTSVKYWDDAKGDVLIGCKECKNSNFIETANNIKYETIKQAFSTCTQPNDPCKCYEKNPEIDYTKETAEEILDTCILKQFMEMDMIDYPNMQTTISQASDFTKELTNANKDIIVRMGMECTKTQECDLNLETETLKSICAGYDIPCNQCNTQKSSYCTSDAGCSKLTIITTQTPAINPGLCVDSKYLSPYQCSWNCVTLTPEECKINRCQKCGANIEKGMAMKDIHNKRYYCNGNYWEKWPMPDGTQCTANTNCDQVTGDEDESICVTAKTCLTCTNKNIGEQQNDVNGDIRICAMTIGKPVWDRIAADGTVCEINTACDPNGKTGGQLSICIKETGKCRQCSTSNKYYADETTDGIIFGCGIEKETEWDETPKRTVEAMTNMNNIYSWGNRISCAPYGYCAFENGSPICKSSMGNCQINDENGGAIAYKKHAKPIVIQMKRDTTNKGEYWITSYYCQRSGSKDICASVGEKSSIAIPEIHGTDTQSYGADIAVGDYNNDGINEVILAARDRYTIDNHIYSKILFTLYKNCGEKLNNCQQIQSGSLALDAAYHALDIGVAIGDYDNNEVNEIIFYTMHEKGGVYTPTIRILEKPQYFSNYKELNLGVLRGSYKYDWTPWDGITAVDLTGGAGGIAVGDLNNDGTNDIIIMQISKGTNYVHNLLLGTNCKDYNCRTIYGASVTAGILSSEVVSGGGIAIGDVDYDGKNELILTAIKRVANGDAQYYTRVGENCTFDNGITCSWASEVSIATAGGRDTKGGGTAVGILRDDATSEYIPGNCADIKNKYVHYTPCTCTGGLYNNPEKELESIVYCNAQTANYVEKKCYNKKEYEGETEYTYGYCIEPGYWWTDTTQQPSFAKLVSQYKKESTKVTCHDIECTKLRSHHCIEIKQGYYHGNAETILAECKPVCWINGNLLFEPEKTETTNEVICSYKYNAFNIKQVQMGGYGGDRLTLVSAS